MNATISPARVRAAGLSRFLRLTLRQTAHLLRAGKLADVRQSVCYLDCCGGRARAACAHAVGGWR